MSNDPKIEHEKAHDRVVMMLARGIVMVLIMIVMGEGFLSHSIDERTSSEVITLVDKVMTAIVAAVAGYLGGSRKREE
jgi:hypothetical protein